VPERERNLDRERGELIEKNRLAMPGTQVLFASAARSHGSGSACRSFCACATAAEALHQRLTTANARHTAKLPRG
jgi:hypothetical protein